MLYQVILVCLFFSIINAGCSRFSLFKLRNHFHVFQHERELLFSTWYGRMLLWKLEMQGVTSAKYILYIVARKCHASGFALAKVLCELTCCCTLYNTVSELLKYRCIFIVCMTVFDKLVTTTRRLKKRKNLFLKLMVKC